MSHERRVFVDLPGPESKDGPLSFDKPIEVSLSPEDSHHLVRVLRLEEGGAITAVSKNENTPYRAIIIAIETENGRPIVRIKLLSAVGAKSSRPRVESLFAALTKGPKNDWICEKASELGVSRIILWRAERSIVRLDEENAKKKLARWQKIAESAAKQSGRDDVAKVYLADSLDNLLEKIKSFNLQASGSLLCCALSREAKEMRALPPAKGSVHILIGPEGDLTANEEDSLKKFGFIPVTLGGLTLRSETAAVAAISMAQGVWGEITA